MGLKDIMENDKHFKAVTYYADRFAKEHLIGVISMQFNNPENTPEQKQQIYERLKELLIHLYGLAALENI